MMKTARRLPGWRRTSAWSTRSLRRTGTAECCSDNGPRKPSYLYSDLLQPLARRRRPPVQVALKVRTALRHQPAHLLLRLHALGRGLDHQAVGQVGNGTDDRHRLTAVAHVMHERLVDLDPVERERTQVTQR